MTKEQTKKCPKCAEGIQLSANKCKHCNADLRNWFIRHKVITGFLILILLGIIGSAVGGDENTNNRSNTQKQANKQPEKASIYKVGDSVTAGSFTYQVTKTEEKTSVGNQFINQQASGIYKIVYLKAKNNASEFKYADSNMFKLVDNKDREFVVSADATTANSTASGKMDFFLERVNPGIEVNGVLIFDIPKDAEGLKLKVSGGFLSSDGAFIEL